MAEVQTRSQKVLFGIGLAILALGTGSFLSLPYTISFVAAFIASPEIAMISIMLASMAAIVIGLGAIFCSVKNLHNPGTGKMQDSGVENPDQQLGQAPNKEQAMAQKFSAAEVPRALDALAQSENKGPLSSSSIASPQSGSTANTSAQVSGAILDNAAVNQEKGVEKQ
jgi:hypothetical protein